ncbi:hypothetical protein [Diaphorobacter sp. HDW4B]|nr:hypothetical protein [Diaphorobacter sp. HDW4B]
MLDPLGDCLRVLSVGEMSMLCWDGTQWRNEKSLLDERIIQQALG